MLTPLLVALAFAQAPSGPSPAGVAVFEAHCAVCHAGTDPRVPTVAALRLLTADAVIAAMTTGPMRQQGAELTDTERRAVADELGARGAGSATRPGTTPPAPRCQTTTAFDPSKGAKWTGWSSDLANTRFQPTAQAGLTADQVPKLTLKWSFGFPDATSARAQPTVAGGRVFVGSQSGAVYSLDAATGCTIWVYQAKSAVRSGIALGPRPGAGSGYAAFFGDGRANAYALDAATGALLWTRNLEDHPSAHVTGTPALYQNRLFVPIASGEEGQGNNPKYECCTFRGSLVALDAATGTLVWKTYTIPSEAKPVGMNASGTTRWGPSGAGIWSSPTIDVARKVVYAATGNMYTEPQQPTSDAIMAFDLETGAVKWASQVTPKDVFVVGCNAPNAANCPAEVGPDFDFGNAPILARLSNGRDAIVAGQKSGVGWALDPDKHGAVLWQYRAGKGSALGGIEFGSAVDHEQAYFAVSDTLNAQPGGLHAVKLAGGQRSWFAAPPPPACGSGRGCNAAILAAITVIPGVVFTGSNDGAVRGYSTRDGSMLWEYDTNREFQTVNGVPARGASISGPGPIVAGGMVFIGSGYGALGGRPGNVLLAFGIEAPPPAPPAQTAPPRLPDGHPDLQGVWNFATLTPLERPVDLAGKPALTDEEAADFEQQALQRNNADRRDGSADADVARAYNDAWYDRGTRVSTRDGVKQASLIVDPPDGRVPALTADGQRRAAARAEARGLHPADGPEDRTLAERCLSFNAGPPMLPGPYNNYVQLFQTRDTVVILNEMIHDARVVPLGGGAHAPASIRRWQGDSLGHWEGDTLVVDTTNFTDKTNFRGAGASMHLVERFTRTGADTLLYEFTVDDPASFTRRWTASLPMTRTDEAMFEYACHEGNYALPDILRGARFQEKDTAKPDGK
jgi:polyvinyl alcohol dehydrogenase (cytochrome)